MKTTMSQYSTVHIQNIVFTIITDGTDKYMYIAWYDCYG